MDKVNIPFVDPWVAKKMKKTLQEEQGMLEEEVKENVRNRMEALKHFEESDKAQSENPNSPEN